MASWCQLPHCKSWKVLVVEICSVLLSYRKGPEMHIGQWWLSDTYIISAKFFCTYTSQQSPINYSLLLSTDSASTDLTQCGCWISVWRAYWIFFFNATIRSRNFCLQPPPTTEGFLNTFEMHFWFFGYVRHFKLPACSPPNLMEFDICRGSGNISLWKLRAHYIQSMLKSQETRNTQVFVVIWHLEPINFCCSPMKNYFQW